ESQTSHPIEPCSIWTSIPDLSPFHLPASRGRLIANGAGRAAGFLTPAFLAAAVLVATFLVAAFLVAAFLITAFLIMECLITAFLAAGFLVAAFLLAVILVAASFVAASFVAAWTAVAAKRATTHRRMRRSAYFCSNMFALLSLFHWKTPALLGGGRPATGAERPRRLASPARLFARWTAGLADFAAMQQSVPAFLVSRAPAPRRPSTRSPELRPASFY